MFGKNFFKGLLWGSMAASVGLLFILAQDEANRQKFKAKGVEIKDTVVDLVSELVKEGKDEIKDLEGEMEKALPAFSENLLKRLEGLEDKVKQLGDLVEL